MLATRRRFLAISGAAVLAASQPAWARETTSAGGPAFGSYWRINVPAKADAESAKQVIEPIIRSIDAALSPYKAGSEISRFNRARSNDWVPISDQASRVVGAALRLAKDTRGAFDPTVGPIVARYGFGPIAGERLGTHKEIDLGPRTIRKREATLTIDPCGVAKGFALDRMVAALDAEGFDSYLLELGGEVFARGRHPANRAWQVAVEQPASGATNIRHVVALGGEAIATSGDAANAFQFGGHRYGHVVDPRSGLPANGSIASVSVLAREATEADGLATALFAMGFEEAAAFSQERSLDALFLVRRADELKSITTGRFSNRLLG